MTPSQSKRMDPEVLRVEAAVIGAGPAGMALAVALINAGVKTLCISPAFQKWTPNYGVWPDQLTDLELEPFYEKVWPNVRVSTPLSKPRDFGRSYAKLDGAALFDDWFLQLRGADATRADTVLSVFFGPSTAYLHLKTGPRVVSDHVFDATGHRPKWVGRDPTSVAYQTAYGVVTRDDSRTMSGSTMGLMNWDAGSVVTAPNGRIPAFDYVMPLSDEITFSELTVLAARPKYSIEELREAALAKYVSGKTEILEEERCFIPMGHSVPALDQRIVGFGAAASMVHPATGYMVERCLRVAPEIGEAVVALRGEGPAKASRALWDVIWPTDRARTHELHRFGLEAMLRLTPEQTWAFFEAFFDLPRERWVSYLSGMAPPGEVARTMLEIFGRVGFSLRSRLLRTALSREGMKLLRGLV